MRRSFFQYLLFGLHLFLGMGATSGGLMLLLNPNGTLLGMDLKWLENTPFNSYLIPGFVLFTLVGILPILTFVGLLLKPEWRWPNKLNIYKNRYWAWAYSLYSGIIVIIWILVQQLITQYFWLQPVMISTGLLIIIFTLIPSVMKKYEMPHVEGPK